MHLRAQLGLSPLGRARLGKDVAAQEADLARMWAEQDRAEAATGEGPSSGVWVGVLVVRRSAGRAMISARWGDGKTGVIRYKRCR